MRNYSAGLIFGVLTSMGFALPADAATSNPTVAITANGVAGKVIVTPGQNLNVTIQSTAGNRAGQNADWWVLAQTPFGMYWCDASARWRPGMAPARQGPLVNLPPTWILNMNAAELPLGTYTLFFILDTQMNGILDPAQYCYSAKVDVDLRLSAFNAGTWRASKAGSYELWVTVNAWGGFDGAYLKVYYNDGWNGALNTTFTPDDIAVVGSSFVAKKEIGVFNSAGDRLEYYEIAGTIQANGSITGTWKGSYYNDPRGMPARQNSKQGSFTALR